MSTAQSVPSTAGDDSSFSDESSEEFLAWLYSPDTLPRSLARTQDPRVSPVDITSSPAPQPLASQPTARVSSTPAPLPHRDGLAQQIELLSLQNPHPRLQCSAP